MKPKYELRPPPKIDDSGIEFSPDGKYFALEVGRNLQKIKRTHGYTVESADWSKDGNTLYVFSANRTSVSLWRLIED